MNILILFHSNSGSTSKMADYVAEGARSVEGAEVRIRDLSNATAEDILWCEGIAVGSPTNLGLMSWPMKKFWDEVMLPYWAKIDGKIGCAFTSSGGWGGGGEIACQSILTILINYGFLVFGVTDYVDKKHTLHYGSIVAKEPRENLDFDICRSLGRRLAEWTSRRSRESV